MSSLFVILFEIVFSRNLSLPLIHREPIEDGGGRSWKFQRSHSSLVDYDDVQSNFTLRSL